MIPQPPVDVEVGPAKPQITAFYSDLMNAGVQIAFQLPSGGNASLNLVNVPDQNPKEIVKAALQSLIDIL